MKEWSDIGSTCKFRNARSAFRNLHVDPLSLHTFMRNKQVEFNPYIYTLTTLSRLYRFGYEISVFNTKHPVIILRVSLFAVTPSHVASTKIECQNFSYVYRSRKHWECKYLSIETKLHSWPLFYPTAMGSGVRWVISDGKCSSDNFYFYHWIHRKKIYYWCESCVVLEWWCFY